MKSTTNPIKYNISYITQTTMDNKVYSYAHVKNGNPGKKDVN